MKTGVHFWHIIVEHLAATSYTADIITVFNAEIIVNSQISQSDN